MPKSSAKKKPGDLPKKRRSPSDFKGARLQFMTDRLPAYVAACKQNKNKSKKGKDKDAGMCAFFVEFFHDYWREFPWRLPLDEEPSGVPENPPEDAEATFKALDLDLTPEEEEKKSKILTDTKLVRSKAGILLH
jgi:hypothetical protein